MDSTLDILARLADQRVEFIIVGGLAGIAHGSSIVTEDLDLCVPMTPSNLEGILAALSELHPRFRMHPARPPLPDDASRLSGFKNLFVTTDIGQVDFLSEITGVGDFKSVERHSVTIQVGGRPCRVLDLDALIRAKRAIGRPKDLRAAVELEAIRERLLNRGFGAAPE